MEHIDLFGEGKAKDRPAHCHRPEGIGKQGDDVERFAVAFGALPSQEKRQQPANDRPDSFEGRREGFAEHIGL
jgi:hypothetical protein